MILLKENEYPLSPNYSIVCRRSYNEITESELQTLTYYRGEKIVLAQIDDHFSKGACLWLIAIEEKVVGMVWTIRQKTLKPYYWPMTPYDVHLFDNEVFPDFRGRGINPLFIDHLLFKLKKEGLVRAFIETRELNGPEIRSLSKTCFNELGRAHKFHIFCCDITIFKKIPSKNN